MIHITEEAYDKMLGDALHGYPYECCGFLFGTEEGGDRKIIAAKQVTNISTEDQRRRFSISATDYIKAERFADENKLLLLGIYHSHPNHPAIPSETDRLAAQPFFSYIIISVENDKDSILRSWRLNDNNQFEEEKINQLNSFTVKI